MFLIVSCEALLAQGVDLSLKQEGRFFLPLDGRFEPDYYNFTATDTNLALLDYDAISHRYSATVYWDIGVVVIHEWVGDRQVYAPRVVPIDQFMLHLRNEYWRQKAWEGSTEDARARREGLSFEIPIDFPKGVRDIIGEGGAGLSLTGYQKITLSGRSEWRSGEILGPDQTKFPSLQMEQESRFTITGTIGTKISVTVDQDSKRQTDLENTINIAYTGTEDDIIQKIEAGNTNISLPGATFVGYSERVEGLFGIKSQFQIGDLSIMAIGSQEKGQHSSTSITGRSSVQPIDIKDHEYLDLTYFWIRPAWVNELLGSGLGMGDSIVEFNLYVDDRISTNNISMNAIRAEAMPEPGDPYDNTIGHIGHFHIIDQSNYEILRTQGWFRMTGYNPLRNDHAIACQYVLRRSDGSLDSVGYHVDTDSTAYLLLIRPPNMLPDNPLWNNTWRNVYSLGATGLNPDNIEIEIYLTPVANGISSDTTQVPPSSFLEVFGLDKFDQQGNAIPDGRVDRLRFDIGQGYLVFPVLKPFNPSSIEQTQLQFGANTPRNEAMYNSVIHQEISRDHKYVIRVLTGTRQNPMPLGRFNIIEGSEVVKLGSRTLQRGVDYRMDYQIGQITFLTEEALNPNIDLHVDFDFEPFFQPEQKSLLGTRMEYRFGEQSWIGGTALYKSTTSSERRPQVGREPSKAFIWDADLKLDYEVPIITDLVNAIPLIRTEQQSRVVFAAEVAQMLGNPNTRNEAYIDDFEGSRNVFSMEIRRTAWTRSSAPPHKTQEQRGWMLWYNPWEKYPVREIWPNKEVAAEESKTNVLVLDYTDTTGTLGVDGWGGVMRYVPSGYQDQSSAQFLEVWVRGETGNLHFNFGSISEDINGNGILDSEDIPVNGIRTGILTAERDVGLDGLPDSLEPGYHSVHNPDPHGDNWYWDPDNPDDYSGINGTEGNRHDPEGGNRPDTEDLNGNDFLDTYNDYYEFTIDLSKDEFEVPGTRSYVGGTGEKWRLFRIPIQDSVFTLVPDGKVYRRKQVGSPNWQQMKYMRIWVDGIQESAKIWIAKMELVGNRWETQSPELEVATKNTHEDADYYSPPDVTGERSLTTGIMSQEQSLVLIYNNVLGADTVLCSRTTFGTQHLDLTLYNRLEMWVYFNADVSDDSVLFTYRMGRDRYNMYEYRTYLKPGWDESNKVVIDFPTITALKNEIITLQADTSYSGHVERVMDLGDGSYYVVRGNPSMTDIRYFEMGVINPYLYRPISGEIWTNELKVTDVRKEPGWAERSEFRINFADLMDFTGTIERKDSEFHNLNQQVGSGVTTTMGALSGRFNAHKFSPESWGLSLPVSANWGRTVSVPRLRTGSDITVPDSLRDEETTRNKQYSVNITQRLTPVNPHWLLALTLSRMTHSVSGGERRESSPHYPLNLSQDWSARQSYDLTPREKWELHLTRWMFAEDKSGDTDTTDAEPEEAKSGAFDRRREADRGDTLVPKLLDWKLNLAPSALRFETSATGRLQRREDRYGSTVRTNDRFLDHTTTFNTNILKPITTGFTLRMKRDIGDSAEVRWRHPVNIGSPLTKSISDNIRFSPTWINWLNQTYEFSSTYNENTDPQRYRDQFGNVDISRTYRLSLGLRWRELKRAFSSGSSPPPSGTPPGRGTTTAESDTGEVDRERTGGFGAVLGKSLNFLDRLDDLQFDHQRDDRRGLPNLEKRPTLAYQLGFTTDPGVPTVETTGGITSLIESRTTTDNTTIRTGVRLPWEINASLRYNYRTNIRYSTNNTKETLRTFPDITLNWNGLGKYFFFPKLASNVRTNARYIHEKKESFQADALTNRSYKHDFNPLVSVNVGWKIGLTSDYSTNWRKSHDYRFSTANTSVTRNNELSHKLTLRYNLRATHGLKLPLFGTIRLENVLQLSLTVQHTQRTNETWIEGNEDAVTPLQDDSEWSLTPSASYSFSRNIQGGMEMRWIDTKDNRLDQVRHIRDVSIWVELKF
ncbi:MAG TPA: cell surface protein SprA [candidate division Zixibacteria bacterium]|nr:cell surface protein SprA [candidate division Zixibacteria bacterium]